MPVCTVLAPRPATSEAVQTLFFAKPGGFQGKSGSVYTNLRWRTARLACEKLRAVDFFAAVFR